MMMKKLNYLLLGLAAVAITSCSQEDMLKGNNPGDGNLNITVKLPGDMATRALGDGFASTNLKYAVYDVTGDLIDNPVFKFEDEAIFEGSLTTTVSLQLVEGKSYQLAFFALSKTADDEGVYTFSPDNTKGGTPNISVAYNKMSGTADVADAYDCFYALTDTYTVGTSATPETVTLNRIVAQINWGTSELNDNNEIDKAYGETGEYIRTNLTVDGTVYTQYNLLESSVAEGSAQTITLFADDEAPVPTGTAFPVDPTTYDYVACQYILVPAESTVYDLTLNINNNGEGTPVIDNKAINVNSAPVQANYKTNIYGNLLSTNATFTVTKSADWGDPSNDINYDEGPLPIVWDGQRESLTIPSSTSEPIIIDSPGKLATLADMIAGRNGQSSNKFNGRTIQLTADFDMNGQEFPMMGTANRTALNTISGNYFQGIFDGQNHTISNLKITSNSSNGSLFAGYPAVGFFPGISGTNTEVKNIKFDNIQISGPNLESAGVVGILFSGAKVTNVTVESGSVTSWEAPGGIVGRIFGSGTVTGCTNSANITAITTEAQKGDAGGIVGEAYRVTSPGITISNCINYGSVSATKQDAGGIVGLSAANVIECINYGDVGGETGNTYAGGIVAYQNSCGSIKNCTNYGKVTGTGMVAGILAYPGGITYTLKEVIEISGNTNNGELIGTGQVAGITCQIGCTLNVFGNINNAPSITSTGTAAGLISNGLKSSGLNGGNGYANIYTLGDQVNINKTPLDNISGSKKTETYFGDFWDLSTNQAIKF